MIDWTNAYSVHLGPFWAKFAELWSYYWLSALWYLFLAGLLLVGFTSRRKMLAWLKIVTAVVSIFVFGVWLSQVKMEMSYSTGVTILVGSIIVAIALVAFVYWKLKQTYNVKLKL
jgi:hypothetical protein